MRITHLSLALFALCLCLRPTPGQEATKVPESNPPASQAESPKGKKTASKDDWRPLLSEKGLEGWQVTDFGGRGEVHRDGELLVLEKGDPLCGITTTRKDFPTDGYEIELEAMRIEGNDFLCGLTYPVGKEFCSLICGGWGGGLVGLSSVDGYDAAENSTSTHYEFKNGEWYKFRLRVDSENITAWINDKEMIKQERDGHEFSTRIEVYVSQPLGFCVFQSKVAVRNFRWRPLK